MTDQERHQQAKDRWAKRQQQRSESFNGSLPSLYRTFNELKHPNLGLCEHLFRFWRQFAEDERGRELPECFGFDGQSGLLLVGAPRAGKTQLACELVRRKVGDPDDAYDARFISVVEWGAETSQRAKDCNLDGWAHQQVKWAWKHDVEYGLLILDDIDKIRLTATVESQLFNLIETATANEMILIVTTNCKAGELVKKFTDKAIGEAIVARLMEFCTPLNVSVPMPRAETPNVLPMEGAA